MEEDERACRILVDATSFPDNVDVLSESVIVFILNPLFGITQVIHEAVRIVSKGNIVTIVPFDGENEESRGEEAEKYYTGSFTIQYVRYGTKKEYLESLRKRIKNPEPDEPSFKTKTRKNLQLTLA